MKVFAASRMPIPCTVTLDTGAAIDCPWTRSRVKRPGAAYSVPAGPGDSESAEVALGKKERVCVEALKKNCRWGGGGGGAKGGAAGGGKKMESKKRRGTVNAPNGGA
jgi:hypothetical protein